ncbi:MULTISPECIES: CoxG family protein [Neobacillus]|uniref:SRPBCC family protein n=1 Tax=Neobacillus rhizophilus TaxID=2833579 RepID=A0A942YWI1_9BACI|nr:MULTISPECIES: SRPBCC family protein [Neobacillus]MBS4216148.1 SRPBCC family protein [Neobacillus rhizophilus]MBU8917291.1 SRPBCC family protein [Bacillus sp. FJAT-29953]
MPTGMHQVEVDVPINKVWKFVKDMDNWAPLIPGYIQHRKFTNRQSIWEFNSNIGFIKKKMSLMVTIKEWIEPTKITFQLKGVNEGLTGEGYFLAEAVDKNKTKITGFLELTAGGATGPVVNAILKSQLPNVTKDMVTAIATKLEQVNNNVSRV